MTTNIPTHMSIQDMKEATQHNTNLQELKEYIIRGWPLSRDEATTRESPSATQQQLGLKENKSTSERVSILGKHEGDHHSMSTTPGTLYKKLRASSYTKMNASCLMM